MIRDLPKMTYDRSCVSTILSKIVVSIHNILNHFIITSSPEHFTASIAYASLSNLFCTCVCSLSFIDRTMFNFARLERFKDKHA